MNLTHFGWIIEISMMWTGRAQFFEISFEKVLHQTMRSHLRCRGPSDADDRHHAMQSSDVCACASRHATCDQGRATTHRIASSTQTLRIKAKPETPGKIGESRQNRRIATKSENRDKIGESRQNRRIATKSENREKI